MNIKPNVGILNALIRITCGLTLLTCSAAKMVKKPWRESYYILVFLSAMKVAEGIVRFCPVTYLLQFFNKNNEQNQDKGQETGKTTEENPM